MNSIIHRGNPVIFFDGECNLCSATVQFIIKHDRSRLFRFASLQSSTGQQVLAIHGFSTTDIKTFLLLQDGIAYTRSTAALRITRHLNGIWPTLYALLLIPPFIRNTIYSLVARNRYRWFGKKNACWLSTPEYSELFIL